MASGGINKPAMKKVHDNLQSQLGVMKIGLENLISAVNAIENTKNLDGNIGLWSGQKAVVWMTNIKKCINSYIDTYNAIGKLNDNFDVLSKL